MRCEVGGVRCCNLNRKILVVKYCKRHLNDEHEGEEGVGDASDYRGWGFKSRGVIIMVGERGAILCQRSSSRHCTERPVLLLEQQPSTALARHVTALSGTATNLWQGGKLCRVMLNVVFWREFEGNGCGTSPCRCGNCNACTRH